MKKLLIALAAIATVGIVNAAAFDWACYMEDPNEDAMSSIVGRLFVSTDSSYVGTLSTKIASGDFSLWTSDGLLEKTTGTNGKVNYGSPYAGSMTAGSYDFFAVFLDTSATDTATAFYVTATKNVTLVDGYDTAVNFGNQYTNVSDWTSITASDVPEPTSGLLLLLGMAGLALKRKRA